ncbi:hypothetical protein [Paraburkholderia sp. HP33-1]|uniref:hypothetical protein n=1 Tax=Paraburkholderia sp. HP33-1 TaxID=2883243 RepID=UPI001F3AEE70|nr:hypothetical protein [Paraburkholderia sp. HP33-1]
MFFSRNIMYIKEASGFSAALRWHSAIKKLTREEYEEIELALNVAHEEFVKWATPGSWTSSDADMSNLRGLLGRVNDRRLRINMMSDHEVASEIHRQLRSRRLVFVPPHWEVKWYLEEERAKRSRAAKSADSPIQHEPAGVGTTRQAVSAGATSVQPTTPLSDGQPFEYTSDVPSGDVDQLAASTINPKYAAKMLGYDQKTFGRMLHEFKPANGLGPADNVIWHDNGDVYFQGNFVANFHDWAD